MPKKLTKSLIQSLEAKEKRYEIRDTEIKGFAVVVYPSKRKSYRYYYRRPDGRSTTYTIGEGISVAQARDIADDCRIRVRRGEDLNTTKQADRDAAQEQKSLIFTNFLKDTYYYTVLKFQRSGDNTLKRLKRMSTNFGGKQLNQISRQDIDRWLRENEHLAPATKKNEFAVLRAMLNWAVEGEYIESHQLTKYEMPKGTSNERTRQLSAEENIRLHAAMKAREAKIRNERTSANEHRLKRGYSALPNLGYFVDHLKPIVILAQNTGMRRGEIFSLVWSNVDFDSKLITIGAAHAKSKKQRSINMNGTTLDTLSEWRRQRNGGSNIVFPSKDGSRLDNIYKSWNTLLSEADIIDFRFHDLRHDFASKLVEKGRSLYEVKTLLGHSSIQQTEKYAHLMPKQLQECVDVLDKPPA